jgi:hypothetical protein
MQAKVANSRRMNVQLPTYLSRRVERTARLTKCKVSEIVASARETSLPLLPEDLPPALTQELAGLMLLDDEALHAIADSFLPRKQQRRFTALLHKQKTRRLSTREHAEWEALQQDYLRVSRNKAKAHYLLVQRQKARMA